MDIFVAKRLEHRVIWMVLIQLLPSNTGKHRLTWVTLLPLLRGSRMILGYDEKCQLIDHASLMMNEDVPQSNTSTSIRLRDEENKFSR